MSKFGKMFFIIVVLWFVIIAALPYNSLIGLPQSIQRGLWIFIACIVSFMYGRDWDER